MTHVDFHVLPPQPRRQHDVFLCELIEREWQAGRRIHVHCGDAENLSALDDLLWTFHDTSFVPHARLGDAEAAHAAVTLSSTPEGPEVSDILINLAFEVPGFFSQFERVIETSGYDEPSRQQARERYRFYKARGYPLVTHNA